MKAVKILLTILLTIILIAVGLSTQILAIVNVTAINPWFYKTALRQMGFYESLRTVMLNQLEGFIEDQDAIPEEYKEDAFKIVENVFSKRKFSRQIGDFLGDSISFFLYDKGDAEIPLQEWIDDLTEEIKDSDIVKEMIVGEKNTADFEHILNVTLTDYLQSFNAITGDSNSLSDTFYRVLAPNAKTKERLDSQLWVLRYWIHWVNLSVFIGFGLIIIILILLFIIWRKKSGVVFRISGVILIVNSVGFVLSGAAMFASLTITKILDLLPPSYISYVNIIQVAINPIALLSFGFGIILLVLGIVILVIGRALTKKSMYINNNVATVVIEEKPLLKDNNIARNEKDDSTSEIEKDTDTE